MSDIADQALAAYNRGQISEAAQLAQRALTADATDIAAKAVLGLSHARRRNIREACRLLSEALEAGSTLTEVPAALATSYARLNGPDALVRHFSNLLKAHPQNIPLRIELAQLFHYRDEPEKSLAVCEEGLAAGVKAPELRLLHGRALFAVDRVEEAIDVLRQYTNDVPSDADGLYLLGAATRAVGRLEEARAMQLAAMRAQPFHPRAFYSYMRSGRVEEDDPVLARLDQLEVLLRSADDETAGYYHYGLGKALEDQKKYNEAWDHYVKGGARLQKRGPYNRRQTEQRFERIKTFFSPERITELARAGDANARPIFIIGMPRSGSTLVEQVLSSHPDVTALGELLDLDRLCSPFIDQMPNIDAAAIPFSKIAEIYLNKTQGRAGADGMRLVDKGLHNFLLVGFIHILFPKAKILHTGRDALDTCLSCLTLRFAGGHEWSNRIADTAHYYHCYRQMMAHWEKVLPGRIIQVKYEDLVAEFEPQVRELINACELPWDRACLDFRSSSHPVRTASSAQVRQGISTSSIGRWKRFEAQLQPLKDALADLI
jgi:tetratricopeptide (TPR) repeat protein